MDELLQQLAQMGLDFDPNDPQFQRVFLANKASQRDLIMNRFRAADAQAGLQFDEAAASEVADEEIFQNSLKQFLTESGQLPAMQQSQIAMQTGERLQTEQDPAKAEALRGQLARLQRLSGLNLNQEEPVAGRNEMARSALGAAAHLVSSPGRFVGRRIGLDDAVAGLESEIANIAPARVTSPVGRFMGEMAGMAVPFGAASKLPFLRTGGPALGELAGGATAAVGSRVFPSASKALAPVAGGGAVREGLKAATRTAIPSAVGGATEFAVLDPAGVEEDPLSTLLMGALLGQGRTVGAAGRGAKIGRFGEREIPTSTLPEDLGPAGPLEEGQVLRFRNNEPTDALRALTDAELEALPMGKTPPLSESGMVERRGGERRGLLDIDVEGIGTGRGKPSGFPPFEEGALPVEARKGFNRRVPAPQRVQIEEPGAPVEPNVLDPRQDVKGYDLASQLDRELGGAREDLARTRIARIQRQLVEAREKRNALLQREASTGLPEPQREELLAMEHHFETLLRDLENARESLRGGSARTGAPFRAIEAARLRVGKPKRRR